METKNNSAEKKKDLAIKEEFWKIWNENPEELRKNIKGKRYCVSKKNNL